MTGCNQLLGVDGDDGDAYIAYSWAAGPITFSTDDPAFSNVTYISNEAYRRTFPGMYHFEYISWNNSYWYGNYTIYIDEGTPGGFLVDGIDGEDLYFELACYSFGPSFYVWTKEFAYLSLNDDFSRRRAGERFQELESADMEGEASFLASATVTKNTPLPLAERQEVSRDGWTIIEIAGDNYKIVLRFRKHPNS